MCVHALSMGKLYHAMMDTASIVITAAVPGTLRVRAAAKEVNGDWAAKKAVMSRSASVIMEGFVCILCDTF